MRTWGHDLDALFNEAIARGLTVAWNATDRTLLVLLNEQYRSREFQYIKTGYKTFPQIDPLAKTVAKMLKAVGDQVPSARGFFLGKRVGRSVMEVLKHD
jgi:hypothetical protein